MKGAEAVARGMTRAEELEADVGGKADFRLQRRLTRERSLRAAARAMKAVAGAQITSSRCEDPDATIDTSTLCTLPILAHDAVAEALGGGADELCRLMEASRWAMSTYGQLVKAVRLRRPQRLRHARGIADEKVDKMHKEQEKLEKRRSAIMNSQEMTRGTPENRPRHGAFPVLVGKNADADEVEVAKLLAAAGKDGVVYNAPEKERRRKAVIVAILKRRPRLEHLCIDDEDALYGLANIPTRTRPRSITHLETSPAVPTSLLPAAINTCPSLTALTIHAHMHEIEWDGQVALRVAAVLNNQRGSRIRKLNLYAWHGQAADLINIIRVCNTVDDLSITLTQGRGWGFGGNHDGLPQFLAQSVGHTLHLSALTIAYPDFTHRWRFEAYIPALYLLCHVDLSALKSLHIDTPRDFVRQLDLESLVARLNAGGLSNLQHIAITAPIEDSPLTTLICAMTSTDPHVVLPELTHLRLCLTLPSTWTALVSADPLIEALGAGAWPKLVRVQLKMEGGSIEGLERLNAVAAGRGIHFLRS